MLRTSQDCVKKSPLSTDRLNSHRNSVFTVRSEESPIKAGSSKVYKARTIDYLIEYSERVIQILKTKNEQSLPKNIKEQVQSFIMMNGWLKKDIASIAN